MQPNKKFGPQNLAVMNYKVGSQTHQYKQKPGAPKRSRSRGKKVEFHLLDTEQQEHPKHPHQNNFQAHHGMYHGIGNVHHFTHIAQRQGLPRLHPAQQFSMHILPEHYLKTSYVAPVNVDEVAISRAAEDPAEDKFESVSPFAGDFHRKAASAPSMENVLRLHLLEKQMKRNTEKGKPYET